MNEINSEEAWRFIPPEEKIELLTKAHAKGVFATILTIIVGGTCAAALKEVWLLWSALISTPFIFQYVSGKAWKDLKPALTLRYLAARSATRRCAFAAQADDLSPQLIFRGVLELSPKANDVEDQILTQRINRKETEVWIALFEDTLVIISEGKRGAILELAHPIDPNLRITRPIGHENDLAPYELILELLDRHSNKIVKISSQYPAAMAVFEKKYQINLVQNKSRDRLLKKGRAMGLKFDDLYEDEKNKLDNLYSL